eukprot:TRINITY_DN538_c0_g1_i1.p1 TRINITY_DN538_c0_g1~~TRINITY_DN538_c0_g1_i1.p1  ORF type:complete len:163 (+),score=40.69 TRINITY_DN538_c0_g1_i1:50-490(+)
MNSLVLLAVSFFCLLCLVSCYSVTGEVKNEWPQDMTLVTYQLTVGTWVKKPPQTISGGSSIYVKDLWEASGADGVVGYVRYGNQYGHAQFNFQNTPSSQNFTTDVGPSPYIGGVGGETGTTDAVVDYWTHQMCVRGSSLKNCINKN